MAKRHGDELPLQQRRHGALAQVGPLGRRPDAGPAVQPRLQPDGQRRVQGGAEGVREEQEGEVAVCPSVVAVIICAI